MGDQPNQPDNQNDRHRRIESCIDKPKRPLISKGLCSGQRMMQQETVELRGEGKADHGKP
jgi:hypothetical protein